MKPYGAWSIALAVVLPLCLAADAAEADREAQLSLSLRGDTGEIVAYEPLRVTVSLRNTSAKAVTVSLGSFLSTMQFTCERPDGRFAITVTGARGWLGGTRELAPGEETTSSQILPLYWHPREERLPEMRSFFTKYGLRGFIFVEPGEYRVKLRVELGKGQIEAEPVGLLVKPVPPDQLPAAKLAADMKAALILWEKGWTDEGLAVLRKLSADFPDSPYADHAHYALGQYYWVKQMKDPGDIPAATAALQHYSAVSARIGAMRARASEHGRDSVQPAPGQTERGPRTTSARTQGLRPLQREDWGGQTLDHPLQATRRLADHAAQALNLM